MKLLLFDFAHYKYRQQGNLTWARVGKTPLVILSETHKYSFVKSVAAHVLYTVQSWCNSQWQRMERDRTRVLFPKMNSGER